MEALDGARIARFAVEHDRDWVFVAISMACWPTKPAEIERRARQVLANVRSIYRDMNVVVLVTDELAYFNLRACNRTHVAAERNARKDGDTMCDALQRALDACPGAAIMRWRAVREDPSYMPAVEVAQRLLAAAGTFAELVHGLARAILRKRFPGVAELNPERIAHSEQYVVHELPSLCRGVRLHDGRYASRLVYPVFPPRRPVAPAAGVDAVEDAAACQERMNALIACVRDSDECAPLRAAMGVEAADFIPRDHLDFPAIAGDDEAA